MGKTSYKLEHYTIKKYYGVLLWCTFMHYTCNGDFINTVYRIVFAHEWLNIVFMDDAESIIAELSSRPQAEMIMNS